MFGADLYGKLTWAITNKGQHVVVRCLDKLFSARDNWHTLASVNEGAHKGLCCLGYFSKAVV